MSSTSFASKVNITHIGTATAILDIDGVRFLTDPAFDPAGSEYPFPIPGHPDFKLVNQNGPAIPVEELPHIDAVLLSHEDHPDNLDTKGRLFLEGRKVFTTEDGAKNLQPRPDVRGMKAWESVATTVGGKGFKITATPCQHVPGNECTGFILESLSFGKHEESGLPNAIFFSGDTVYFPELDKIKEKWHLALAILNCGSVLVPLPTGGLLVTMDGEQAVALVNTLQPDVVVPMHYEGWAHFAQSRAQLAEAFANAGMNDRVRWLEMGKAVPVV
jgi:L-ascorbate metabolism protein UlaG (beta-lactamase superfamily)